MTPFILAVLGLFVVQTIVPTALRYFTQPALRPHLGDALRARDTPPPMPLVGSRADRALANLQEALPVFLGLALLVELKGVAAGLATQGALVFLIARVLYVPAYLTAIAGVRSTVWSVSWLGLGMMIATLLRAG